MHDACLAHAQYPSGDGGNVDDAATGERAAVDDGDDCIAAVIEIGDAHVRAKGQRAMSGDQAAVPGIVIVSRHSVFVGFGFGASSAGERYRSDENMFNHGCLVGSALASPDLARTGTSL